MKSTPTFLKKTSLLASVTTIILLIPYLAMQFTQAVNWSPADFILAGILLFGTGMGYLLMTERPTGLVYKFAVGLALATALFMVWSNLAVGIIGSEGQPINLVYFGLLLVGLAGAVYVRFRSLGMSRVLFFLAAAQLLIGVLALAFGMHQLPGASFTEITLVNGFFMVLWLFSAILFRYDGQNFRRFSSQTSTV